MVGHRVKYLNYREGTIVGKYLGSDTVYAGDVCEPVIVSVDFFLIVDESTNELEHIRCSDVISIVPGIQEEFE